MSLKPTQTFFSLSITILLIIPLNIFFTSVIPSFGIHGFLPPFHILTITFLSLRAHTSFLPFCILIIQIFHSLFTIESWAYQTIAGITLSILLHYANKITHFSSAISIIIVTFSSSFIWYFVYAIFIYLNSKNLDLDLIPMKNAVPEIIVISLVSPLLFPALNQIWKIKSINEVNT